MEIASSRRKQNRPARIEDEDDDASENSFLIEERSRRGSDSPVEMRHVGCELGPYKAHRIPFTVNCPDNTLMLLDSDGNAAIFEVEKGSLLCSVQAASNKDEANCLLTEQAGEPDALRMVIIKAVPVNETLLALFSTNVDQNNELEDPTEEKTGSAIVKSEPPSSDPSPSMVPTDQIPLDAFIRASLTPHPFLTSLQPQPIHPSILSTPQSVTPNKVIYLPIGYHNMPHPAIQILGPAQTIIPIAIGRPDFSVSETSPFFDSSLLIHPEKCGLVPVPTSIQFSAGDVSTSIPIATKSAMPLISLQMPVLSPQHTLFVPPTIPPKPKMSVPPKKRVSASPLDLSRKRRKTVGGETFRNTDLADPSGSSTESTAIAETVKAVAQNTPKNGSSPSVTPALASRPFPCACGVSFSNESTFTAHKTSYCKLTPSKNNNENSGAKEATKMPRRCSHCEYTPANMSQLSVHMRNHHAEAFVCKICGYRGFSVRGIRSHLRTHSELDSVPFDDLLPTHVIRSAITKGKSGESPPLEDSIQSVIESIATVK